MASARDYRCMRCKTPFLPFRSGVPCPSCARPADAELPIVAAVLRTYAENLARHGAGVPPTITVGTTWDDYLFRGLFFLRALDSRRPRESEETVLARSVTMVDGSKGTGWRGHLEDFYRTILRARHGPLRPRRRGTSEREK